jgi:outer membrane receptor protein involved in Fe transport
VQARMGVGHNGIGSQLTTNWRSRTRITAGTAADPNEIVFSPVLRFDLSAFANLGTMFPGTPLLTDTRVTLNVENVLDEKQRVRDETGTTPLRYQPYLLNALGRTVSLSLRKMF